MGGNNTGGTYKVIIAEDPCRKCGELAWYEVEHIDSETSDVVKRCVCGLNDYVFTSRRGVQVTHRAREREARPPETGTILSVCLGSFGVEYPRHMTTADVARLVGLDRKKAFYHLAVLTHKGFVERVSNGQGVCGGSTWKLSSRGRTFLNLRSMEEMECTKSRRQ